MGVALMTIIGIGLIVVGLFLYLSSPKKDKVEMQEQAKKDGLPILPRDQRQKPTIMDSDALSHLATVATTHEQHHEERTSEKAFESVQQEIKATVFDPQPTPTPEKLVVFDSQALEVDESVAVYNEERAKAQDPLQKFDGQATALDQHFHEQEMEHASNQKALLHNRETITLIIRPKNGGTVSGNAILQLAQDYAMKYGVLKMFHRYEDAEGVGQLWFSMLGLGENGIEDFDLVALPMQQFRGVALFLSLPHPQALRGFDSMVSVAHAIADELDAEMLDEEGLVLENSHLQSLRNVVASYP